MTGATVYVPRDAAARSVGADEVAAAVLAGADAHDLQLRLVRTGSRGMAWLEPLVEVATAAGRVGFGPVGVADVPGLLPAIRAAATDLSGPDHPLDLGLVEEIPWLARQQRLIFGRVGVVDPVSAVDHLAHGGFTGLAAALAMPPERIVAEVTASGLRGRGGAGFPVGVKWRTVADAPGETRQICCNADEGDSGTFADRMLIEGDPFLLIEGMLIAAHAVGARSGVVYLRSEYPAAIATLREAIAVCYREGWLGPPALGPPALGPAGLGSAAGTAGAGFDLEIRVGAGSYVCGEETAMLESIEGRRGQVRARPPLPAVAGLFGQPTVVNNVLSLASVPWIMAHGAAAYQEFGTGRSRGTQAFQLGGNIRRGGLVETGFGVTLRELVQDYGGGTRSGRPVRAVQVGGPLGAYLPAEALDVPMDYEALAAVGGMLGHGGVVVFDDTVDLAHQARFAMEFCATESCGKCTPCRVGAVRGVEVIDRIIAGEDRAANLALLVDLCEVMTDGSLCAMGGLTPLPVRSALRHFGADFQGPAAPTAAAGMGE
ncbi:MAG: formate dehydrogenase [Actinobacteria bacterium]|nr:formate dehydrogenase [Actinomycetota bacterium]